jgi:Cys-rich repeat protein
MALFAGCGDDGQSYTPCTLDTDCAANESCDNGECKPASGCNSDADCKGSRRCIEGWCREGGCTQDSDCGEKQICQNSVCVDVGCVGHVDCLPEQYCDDSNSCVNDECSTDADCAMGEECAPEGFCREKQAQTCTVHAECTEPELCIDGTCQIPPSCTEDPDCPAGLVCEGGRCAAPCAVDTDCGDFGFTCQNGHCFQQCLSDDTCREANTICENNICVPAECLSDDECPAGQIRCKGGRCEPYTTCTSDADCEANYECLDNICEELPLCSIDNDCTQDCTAAACICKDGHCHEAATCTAEADCTAEEDCVGGICVPHLCRGPADCQPTEICVDGACVTGGNAGLVYEVIILTPGGPIRSGRQIQLEAIALTQTGDEVPGIGFDWDSSQTNRAAVDAAGVLTGGNVAGDTDVTATAQGTAPPVVSMAVTFTNVLDPANNTVRVSVVNAFDRNPVAGATVVLDDGTNQETGTTDAAGAVELSDPGTAADIHVFSDDHDYVSILGTISKDLLVPLPDRSNMTKAGGFSGEMTFVGEGSVSLGLAGTSIAGQLVDMNFSRLLGETFVVTVSTPMGTTEIPLPAQMVVSATFQGIDIPIKETYYVLGQRGLRAAWSMGGFIDMSVLMSLIQGGNYDDMIMELLPYFSIFKHGLVPVFDVFPQDLVVDANDLDGDQDSTEMRPDWGGALPDLDMEPAHSQDIYLNVAAPSTPTYGGTAITSVIYVAGGLSSLGFTPLGLTSAEAVNSVVDPMTMKMAAAYGGLEVGEYGVLVMAVPPAVNNVMPADVAMVLYVDKNLPTNVSFDYGFLAFPEDATFTAASRELTATAVAGASMYRSTIQATEGRWIVYLSGSGTITYTLPAVPGGMDDLGTGTVVTLDPISLSGGLTFEDLVTFNGEDLDVLNSLSLAFTHHQL